MSTNHRRRRSAHHPRLFRQEFVDAELVDPAVTGDLLQRGNRSVQILEADTRTRTRNWNTPPPPFIWTKPAEQILTSLARLLKRIPGAGYKI